MKTDRVAIIGSGPAGLMAAEVLSGAGIGVDIYEAMPSAGRKFLMAGKSGLNITNALPAQPFLDNYPALVAPLRNALNAFGGPEVTAWMQGLGIDAITGPTGRVFPQQMKASPLLRAWLRRLEASGCRLHLRHRWTGWDDAGKLLFSTPEGDLAVAAPATVFALGGASWKRLGSDGAWASRFAAQDISLAPFRPSNCGFTIDWSDRMRRDFNGTPVKNVKAWVEDGLRQVITQEEFVVTQCGVESGAIFSLSLVLRDELARQGKATIWLDLLPDIDKARLTSALRQDRGSQSFANHLRKAANLTGVKRALLHEFGDRESFDDAEKLARQIKRLPMPVTGTVPMDEAISTAGGVAWAALDDDFMLTSRAGAFCAGEMIDWDAPTGGFLLTACLATGRAAGQGALRWLGQQGA